VPPKPSRSSDSPQIPARAKSVSLKDIAQELGISYSLVSKVLNGKMGNTGVRDELRDTIISTARKMNYRPNSLASALKGGRKGAVGVMLHPVGEPGSGLITSFLRGVSAGLDERGARMWLRFFEFDAELLKHIDQRLRHDVDGLIVAGVPHPATYAMLSGLHLSGLPIVSMLERDNIPGVTNVSPDRQMQGELAARHLLSLGCTRIAHIFVPGMQLRYDGSLAAHAAHGVELDPRLVYPADGYTKATGAAAVRHWLETGLKFDGILAQSDPQAAGVIEELQRRGIRVPADVRVVGVDNSPLCDVVSVTITSVTAEMAAVGRLAADLLARKMNGENVESVKITPKLVVRDSA
jgi:LacI family transcriptional regulator